MNQKTKIKNPDKFLIFISILLGCISSTYAKIPFGDQHIIAQTHAQSPTSLFTADLNGDGDQDILSVLANGAKLAWFANDGKGHIGEQQIIATDLDLTRAWAADLDDDGDLDVLCTSHHYSKIAYYLNDGTGHFGEQQILTMNHDGDHYKTITMYSTTADLNNDGNLDILAATENHLVWYENNGNAYFSAQKSVSKLTKQFDYIITVDIDNDGATDVVSFSPKYNKIVWYKNDGTGEHFWDEKNVANIDSATAIHAGDLDGDGDKDILATSTNADVIAWYQNDGEGHFSEQKNITVANDQYINITSADLDKDGDQDVLSIAENDSNSIITWYANDGTGNFSQPKVISSFYHFGLSVYITDMDANGTPNVLFASSDDSKIAWYSNDGNGHFNNLNNITESIDRTYDINLADFDNDGDNDILSASLHNIHWHENDGSGYFSAQKVVATSNEEITNVRVADFNNDGNTDVLVVSQKAGKNKINWYTNNGAGQFTIQQRFSIHFTNYFDIIEIAPICIADLDGDSDMDILVTSGTSVNDTITWYANNGSGFFEKGESIISSNINPIATLHVADLDGDGDLDMIHSPIGSEGIIYWRENNGSGQFGEKQIITSDAYDVTKLHAADLDNDGDMDVISSTIWEVKYAWYENDGAGNFAEPKSINTSAIGLADIYTADLDNDGDLDAMSASKDDNRIAVYENFGGGHFWEQQTLTTSAINAQAVYADDLDGDGDMDIIYISDNYTKIAWYENLTSTILAKNKHQLPHDFDLAQNYPNPFNPSTQIEYHLKNAGLVNLSIYNINGQLVQELVNAYQLPGNYSVNVDMSGLPSGVYFYKIDVGDFHNVKKMIKIQ